MDAALGGESCENLDLLSPHLRDALRSRLYSRLDSDSLQALRAACRQLRCEVNACVRSIAIDIQDLGVYTSDLHARFPALERLKLGVWEHAPPFVHSQELRAWAARELPQLNRLTCLIALEGSIDDSEDRFAVGNAAANVWAVMQHAPSTISEVFLLQQAGLQAALNVAAERLPGLRSLTVRA